MKIASFASEEDDEVSIGIKLTQEGLLLIAEEASLIAEEASLITEGCQVGQREE